MAIIVELVAQDEHTVALHSFDADSISIGRSLDNDFVVSDPYVDPHHLTVSAGATLSSLVVQDRGTLNGSRLGRRRLSGQAQEVRSGCVVHIGKTSLRISDSSSSVEPARKLTAVDSFYDWAGSSLVCTGVLATVLLFASFTAWVSSDASMQPMQYFEKLTNPLGTLMVTAAFWAIVGRVIKRRVNFVAHLTIAALTQFVIIAWTMSMSILTINLSMVSALPILGFLGRGVFFVASLELHLRLATNVDPRRRLIFELLVLLLMFIYPTYKQIDAASSFRAVAPYSSSVLPPSLQFFSTTPTADFMVKAGETLDESSALAREKRAAGVEEPEPVVDSSSAGEDEIP